MVVQPTPYPNPYECFEAYCENAVILRLNGVPLCETHVQQLIRILEELITYAASS